MRRSKVVEGRLVIAEVGDVIERESGNCDRLLECEWDGADFRWPNPIQEWKMSHARAVNIHITGRTFQHRSGGTWWVRVSMEFVGDGEPSTFCRAWLKTNPWLLARVDVA